MSSAFVMMYTFTFLLNVGCRKYCFPMLDSQSFFSAKLHRLNNPSLLHLTIQSDLCSFASFIISYTPVSGCLYFTVLHFTILNSSCILLILSPIIYIAVNLCIFLKNIKWIETWLTIIKVQIKRICVFLRDFVYVTESSGNMVFIGAERFKKIYLIQKEERENKLKQESKQKGGKPIIRCDVDV